jgi:GNAT superfamily N-acetyltransferase
LFAKTVSPICIREAVDDDLAAVLALYAQPEIDNGDILSPQNARTILERFRSYPNYKLYVACREGEVVGTFTLLIMENLAHRGAPSGVVEDVVVAARHQRGGVGKKMMRFALDHCREAGCYKMALSSGAHRLAAHRFYDSLGFVRHGYSFRMELERGEQAGAANRSQSGSSETNGISGAAGSGR